MSQHISLEELRAISVADGVPSRATLDHLDACEHCCRQLDDSAADSTWWQRACDHLGTASQDSTHASFVQQATSRIFAATAPADPLQAADSSGGHDDLIPILGSPSHPELLGRVDQFDIVEMIGRGGMGIVLKGYDQQLNRAVAIKFLAPHLATNGVARQRFAREARAAASISHPNVVPIHAICEARQPYLVMPLVSGPSLQKFVRQNGPLSTKDAVRVAMQVAGGLQAAHQQGIVHRDIKPANVLLDGDIGRVMITDFGLARAADDVAVTQTGWLAGTPHYMSPEQTQGQDIDARSDLFSLGALLYYLVTGREPFRAPQPMAVLAKIANQPHLPARAVNPDVSQPLSSAIDKLLEKSPAARFNSAEQAHRWFGDYLAYLQHPQTARRPQRVWTRGHKRRLLYAGLAAVSLIVGVAAVRWYQTASLAGVEQSASMDPTEPANDVVIESLFASPNDPFVGAVRQLENDIEQLESQWRSPGGMSQFGLAASGYAGKANRLAREIGSVEERLRGSWRPFATQFSEDLNQLNVDMSELERRVGIPEVKNSQLPIEGE